MPKASRDSLNAKGKIDIYTFDPEDVVLVETKESAVYDKRVNLAPSEGMVANMMYAPNGVPQGVLEPCIGRRNPETGKVEITDGRRRTINAREANKRLKKAGIEPIRLPVHIRKSNDQQAMAIMISANEHRLDDSATGKAEKMQRYIEAGRDAKEVAVLFGISEASVKNMLRLLDAPAAVRNAVDSGKITASDGYKLARDEPEEAKKKLEKLITHAPRTPGKKRSKNAKKARAIVSNGKSDAVADAKAEKAEKKIEDATAKAIAAWIDANWSGDEWAGAPSEIPKKIRAGEWRT